MSERNNKPETDLMKPNLKNPPAAGQAATVKPGRADSDFDAAKYTPAPLQRRALTNEQWAQPAIGQPNAGIQSINEAVRTNSQWVQPLRQQMARVIVGQEQLIDRLIVGLLSNGHILLEGVPGLAKTLALKTLASAIGLQFQRLQFTPDMLPADIVGTMIYNPRDGSFSAKARSDLFEPDSGGRNQSRACESAKCIARSDAGAPGDTRRRNLSVAGSVSCSRDAKPTRAGRHLSRYRKHRSIVL